MSSIEEIKKEMYTIKKDMSLDDARLILIDANLVQRQNLLPSERAKAYKIQQEVLSKNLSKRVKIETIKNGDKASEIGHYRDLSHDATNLKNKIF